MRILTILEERTGIIEKKMLGGVGYFLHRNKAYDVLGDEFTIRVSINQIESALSRPFVQLFMVPGGKPMTGWVLVSLEGVEIVKDMQP